MRDATPIRPLTRQQLPRHPHRDWLAAVGFRGDAGSFAFLPDRSVVAAPNEGERLWRFAHLPMQLPEGTYRLDTSDARGELALGWELGSYQFTRYRKARRAPALLEASSAAGEELRSIAASVFLARDLINTPCEDLGPGELAEAVSAVGRQFGAKVKSTVGEELLARNYPAIHMVGRAAARAPRLVDLRWGNDDDPRVTLVGKGVCFDTGGLNIKPREGMLEMKKDMGGAAVMLGLARALMSANLPIRLRLLVPAVENSISANAYRPLDIITTRAGKTVEIGNTDAEGRLILCDALAEADSEAPELLIDAATLTGAAKVALGTEVQALFCDDDAAATAMVRAGFAVGDPLWRLPIWRPYRRQIDGKCADLNNVAPTMMGGSIIAALYLAEFVSRARTWAHLDIMAANTAARPGRPEGGEATGLRALYEYISRRFKAASRTSRKSPSRRAR
jgi:leucyl aminopeptidase